MSAYRLQAVANLARQLGFTPLETRRHQLNQAEKLLHDLNANKAYPLDFVVYRVTGYQPKSSSNAELFTGLALQHDFGLLIEQVSYGLNLRIEQIAEPVLAIDDVTQRFNVTSKTIQRWRRRGLPARHFIFPDGKRRVGFLLSSVERFIAVHRDQMGSTTLCTLLNDDDQTAIVRNARRLAVDCRCCLDEIVLRIGKKFHRTPMAVLHTLRKHDTDHPTDAILTLAADQLTDDQVAIIIHSKKDGRRIRSLASALGRPRSVIYRTLMQDRVARLNKRKVRFIDDALYHQPDAEQIVNAIVSQQELSTAPTPTETRIPRDLPPYLCDLYRTPLLSPAKERALFLKFNFYKFQFVTARRKLEPEFAGSGDLKHLEKNLHDIVAVKNQILQANLRLVVSVARRHVRSNVCLMELISEGNFILMRAVEGFDIHKGFRLSTYATLALMKGFAQIVPMLLARHRENTHTQILEMVPDRRIDSAVDHRLDRDHVHHLLNRLDDRERRVLLAYYGLDSHTAATYEQLGRQLGISKQRVRQIEQSALAKLRNA